MPDHNLWVDYLDIQTLKAQCTASSPNVGLVNGAIIALLSLVTVFKSFEEQTTSICVMAYHNLRGHPAGEPGGSVDRIVLSTL